jgi:maltooligosyltrehalose trehalohydrolase
MPLSRRLPIGAEVQGEGTHFRIWAPMRKRAAVVPEGGRSRRLEPEGNGYHSAFLAGIGDGGQYRVQLDDDPFPYPDPASRFQPGGPDGPSQIVDPYRFRWTDRDWKGISLAGQVLYEMHIGTFTSEGTWHSAEQQLPELAALGITCLEVMPVAEFPGRFGWGYDGVNLCAPSHLYGSPDDFRGFVDAAHRSGLGVILDVVYNHFGPDGNYLSAFSPAYFSKKYETDWGEAINFDGPNSGPVREFYLANAAYWIDEYHLDGLRLDATQNIYDDAAPDRHILTEIGRSVRAAAKGRATFVVNENEPQHSELCTPIKDGGYGLDGLWNDDFHHSAEVALTGRNEAYYTDYRGTPQEFISAAKFGYLYQGQWYGWQKKRRGHPGFNLPPWAFINFLENHDQVANSGRGLRLHQLSHPGRYRAMLAMLLLGPGTPMLFQGQEFAATSPFVYFADHRPELAKLVKAGRVEFLHQFDSLTDPAMEAVFAPPNDPASFTRCKLDFAQRETNAAAYRLTRDLLALRRNDPVFSTPRAGGVDGAVLGEHTFALRFFGGGLDRLLLINLGRDLHPSSIPEPLLAPPPNAVWRPLFSTEDPRYGGSGIAPIESEERGWRIPGESATVLRVLRRGQDGDI